MVWITKYALSRGIFEAEELARNEFTVRVRDNNGLNGWSIYRGVDWHDTREAAVARANDMRRAKIASLRRQIDKLEALDWD